MSNRDGTKSETPLTDLSSTQTGSTQTGSTQTGPTRSADRRTSEHAAFYAAWNQFLSWMLEYAKGHPQATFEKQADFPDYIYRMERPYDLPTTVMSASLSDLKGRPLLLVNASPRHTVFKEVVLHPFESHVYRKLTYNADKGALAEGKRPFTKEMLFRLADGLYGSDSKPAE